MAHYAYNKKLAKITKFEKRLDFIDIGCRDLGDFYNKGWRFADSLEEAIEGIGDEE